MCTVLTPHAATTSQNTMATMATTPCEVQPLTVSRIQMFCVRPSMSHSGYELAKETKTITPRGFIIRMVMCANALYRHIII